MAKTTNSRKLIFVLFLTLIASCSLKVDEENTSQSEGNLQQVIQLKKLGIKGVPTGQRSTQNFENFLNKTYQIEACLVESATNETLFGRGFTVKTQHGEFDRTADPSGCVVFPYFIEIDVKSSQKIYRGQAEIILKEFDNYRLELSFGIDETANKIIDLGDVNENEALATPALKDDGEGSYTITNFLMNFKAQLSPNEINLESVKYGASGEICLQYKTSTRQIGFAPLEITILNLENSYSTKVETETRGKCANFDFETNYDKYGSAEHFIPHLMTIKVFDDRGNYEVIEREFHLNPWQFRRNLFFHDSEINGPPPEPDSDSTPKIHVNNLSYSFAGNHHDGFRLNEYLDLNIVKTYFFNMEPKLAYAYNFTGSSPYRELPDGEYRVKVALYTPNGKDQIELNHQNIDQFKVFSADEKIVSSQNGKMRVRMEFPIRFSDLPKGAIRSYLVMKISPAHIEGPRPAIVTGQFQMSVHRLSTPLKQEPDNTLTTEMKEFVEGLSERIDKLIIPGLESKPKNYWKVSPKEAFPKFFADSQARYKELTKINFEEVKKLTGQLITDNEFRIFFENRTVRTLKKLCKLIYPSTISSGLFGSSESYHPVYRRCLGEPGKYLETFNMRVIDHITSPPVRVNSGSDRLMVGTGFDFSERESSRVSDARRRSVGGGVSAKLEIPFLSFLSIGGGVNYDISHTESTDRSRDHGMRGQIGRSRVLFIDSLTLKFRAKSLICSLIQGKPYQINTSRRSRRSTVQTREELSRERFMICDDNAEEDEHEETWYYIGESNPSFTLLRDKQSADEDQMIKIIRGKANFNRFYHLMGDDSKTVFFKKSKQLPETSDFFQLIYNNNGRTRPVLIDGAIPGAIEE